MWRLAYHEPDLVASDRHSRPLCILFGRNIALLVSVLRALRKRVCFSYLFASELNLSVSWSEKYKKKSTLVQIELAKTNGGEKMVILQCAQAKRDLNFKAIYGRVSKNKKTWLL